MLKRLDEDERMKIEASNLEGTNSMAREIILINESGLYNAVLGSKKEEAKQFKKWVTGEVLPSIRKNGIYATENKIEEMINNPDFAISLLTTLKKEREEKTALIGVNKTLVDKIDGDKPRVDFAKAIESSATSVSVREYAKIISKDGFIIGEKKLFLWFRDNEYLMYNNEPYQKYINQGLFEVTEGFYIVKDETVPYKRTLITGKGQLYLAVR